MKQKTGFWLFRNKVGNNVFCLNDIFKKFDSPRTWRPREKAKHILTASIGNTSIKAGIILSTAASPLGSAWVPVTYI